MLLALLSAFGCSRPTPELSTEGATQSGPTPVPQAVGSDEGPDEAPSSANSQETGPPFQKSEVIPAGSFVTVRLKAPLNAGSGSKQSFEAVLDEPVLVDGNPLVQRDAIASGEVESAQVSDVRPDRGYMRLTLTSFQLDGVPVPIQTASLFVRPPSSGRANSIAIRLEKGRRLTFRLKNEVFLHSNLSKSSQ